MKGFKWLLSQNQRVRVDCLAYRRWKAPAKYIKPLLKKTLNSNDVSTWTIHLILVKLQAYSLQTANLLQTDFTIDFLWKQPVLNSVFWEKKVSDVPVFKLICSLAVRSLEFYGDRGRPYLHDLSEEALKILFCFQENLLGGSFCWITLQI